MNDKIVCDKCSGDLFKVVVGEFEIVFICQECGHENKYEK